MAKVFQPYEIMTTKLRALKAQRTLTREELKKMCSQLDSLEPSKAAIVFGLIYEHGKDQVSSAPVFGKGKVALPFKGARSGDSASFDMNDLPEFLRLVIFEYLKLDEEIIKDREGRGGVVGGIGGVGGEGDAKRIGGAGSISKGVDKF
jgi:hypothetical protein